MRKRRKNKERKKTEEGQRRKAGLGWARFNIPLNTFLGHREGWEASFTRLSPHKIWS